MKHPKATTREPVSIEFEEEIDRLYSLPLDRFTAERTAVVRALRQEGRRAEAARIGELRKPTLAAWTVNQLARRNRKDVDLLLDAGHRLATAQADVLAGGDPNQLQDARERERTALRRLSEAASEILGDRASEGTIRQVADTLRLAALSEEGRELLARGRLTGEVEPTGFELVAAVAPASPSRPAVKAPKTSPDLGRPPPRHGRAVDEQAERAREETRRRREQAAARKQAIASAREALDAAHERERELADQVRIARRAFRDAEKALARAERELKAIEDKWRVAGEDVDAAEQALKEARAAD